MTSQLEQFAVWVTSKVEELSGLSPEQLDCLGRLVDLQKKQRAKKQVSPASAGIVASLAVLIQEREGFDVELAIEPGTAVPSEWPFRRGIQREHTVETWKASRLAKVLPDVTAKVLLADGKEADGWSTVGEVRESYKQKPAAEVRRPLKLGKPHANGVAHA